MVKTSTTLRPMFMCLATMATYILVFSRGVKGFQPYHNFVKGWFGRRTLMSMSTSAASHEGKRVVICGGGITGCSIAYYLTLQGVRPLVLERSSIASAASGKAGGFLARGWGDGGVTQALHHMGFDLHVSLAEKLDITSFRKLKTLSVRGGVKGRTDRDRPTWLDGIAQSRLMDANTAQVTPKEFTEKIMEAAKANGAQVKIGTVKGVKMHEAGGERKVSHVILEGGEEMEVDDLVVAMGPWSVYAEDWFGLPVPMEGIKSTSLVFPGCEPAVTEPYALFCAEDNNGCHLEVYPRPNGEVYICGIGGSDYVDAPRLKEGGDCEKPEDIGADPRRVKAALNSFRSLTSMTDTTEPHAQACMRPCYSDGLPALGRIPDVANAFITTGSNCWGILWAPILGLLTAELVCNGSVKTLDISAFNPGRFIKRAKGRGRKQVDDDVGEQW